VRQFSSERRLGTLSALLVALAGLIHLLLAPQHWAHAPAHGAFFVVAGIAEIVWSIAVWRRPSPTLYHIGLVGAGGLVVLWGITRILPAPFGHGPEPVETMALVCKASEGLSVVVLAALIFQAIATRTQQGVAWRSIVLLVVAAFIAGFLTYGVARAAEPVLPWLGATEHQHEEENMPDTEHQHEHGHEHETSPASEHDH
jgi:uncharacterized membrane protein